MRILRREEVWIHTHFVLDSKELDPKDRQKVKLEVESFLRSLNIVFGIHFREGENLRVVLECIPEKEKLAKIEERLNEILKPFKPKPPIKRIILEGKNHGN